MKEFVLESLREQQGHILFLMEQSSRDRVPEASVLDWALEASLTTYRELTADHLSWWNAARQWHIAGSAAHECDEAMYEKRARQNYEAQLEKLRAEVSASSDGRQVAR